MLLYNNNWILLCNTNWILLYNKNWILQCSINLILLCNNNWIFVCNKNEIVLCYTNWLKITLNVLRQFNYNIVQNLMSFFAKCYLKSGIKNLKVEIINIYIALYSFCCPHSRRGLTLFSSRDRLIWLFFYMYCDKSELLFVQSSV